jgi:hypothetical protein
MISAATGNFSNCDRRRFDGAAVGPAPVGPAAVNVGPVVVLCSIEPVLHPLVDVVEGVTEAVLIEGRLKLTSQKTFFFYYVRPFFSAVG